MQRILASTLIGWYLIVGNEQPLKLDWYTDRDDCLWAIKNTYNNDSSFNSANLPPMACIPGPNEAAGAQK